MSYKVEYTSKARKQIRKLDKQTQFLVKAWIDKNLIGCNNPRLSGKQLKGEYKDYWRYRIGSYRLISLIEDDKLIITAITIGHRKEVYKQL